MHEHYGGVARAMPFFMSADVVATLRRASAGSPMSLYRIHHVVQVLNHVMTHSQGHPDRLAMCGHLQKVVSFCVYLIHLCRCDPFVTPQVLPR